MLTQCRCLRVSNLPPKTTMRTRGGDGEQPNRQGAQRIGIQEWIETPSFSRSAGSQGTPNSTPIRQIPVGIARAVADRRARQQAPQPQPCRRFKFKMLPSVRQANGIHDEGKDMGMRWPSCASSFVGFRGDGGGFYKSNALFDDPMVVGLLRRPLGKLDQVGKRKQFQDQLFLMGANGQCTKPFRSSSVERSRAG